MCGLCDRFRTGRQERPAGSWFCAGTPEEIAAACEASIPEGFKGISYKETI